MPTDLDDPRLIFLPFELATKAPAGECNVVIDAWWAVHPERGLLFWAPRRQAKPTSRPRALAPQYNHDRKITEMLASQMYPWAEIRQIPFVYYRLDQDGGPVLPEECYA